jgi:hypothetical protein
MSDRFGAGRGIPGSKAELPRWGESGSCAGRHSRRRGVDAAWAYIARTPPSTWISDPVM